MIAYGVVHRDGRVHLGEYPHLAEIAAVHVLQYGDEFEIEFDLPRTTAIRTTLHGCG